MKWLKLLLIGVLLSLFACRKEHPIDEIFRWTATDVPAADSAMLSIERYFSNYYNEPRSKDRGRKLIADFCSIADLYPENQSLHLRKEYLRIGQTQYMYKSRFQSLMDSIMPTIDSLKYPDEFHRFNALRLEGDYDIVNRYNWALENVSFYEKRKDSIELARNLNYAGNIMLHLRDTVKALQYFYKAKNVCERIKYHHGAGVALCNIAILSPHSVKDSIFNLLINDSLLIHHLNVRTAILHNSFILNDSVKLLQEAIEILDNNNVDHNNYSLVLGFLGDYYVRHGEPQRGIPIIFQAIDTAMKYTPGSGRHLSCLYEFLAYAYHDIDEKDSCILAFAELRKYQLLYNSQITQGEVYAKDAAMRIRMAEDSIRHQKQLSISILVIVILIFVLILLWLLFRISRNRMEKYHQEEMMRERNERNLQSIRAQSKVMEESDKLVESLEDKINELKTNSIISDDGANSLNRIIKIHKSNDDSRKGFLKVQQELDTRFVNNLKRDFPTLIETQIKLASLIAAGLDKRQIGNILNIEQSSVLKSRYRLRTRLGLSKDESLEEFLRQYNRDL